MAQVEDSSLPFRSTFNNIPSVSFRISVASTRPVDWPRSTVPCNDPVEFYC